MEASRSVVFSSDLGWMAAVFHAGRLYRLTFGHTSPRAAVARLQGAPPPRDPDRSAGRLIARLQAFSRGGCDDDFLDVELDEGDLSEFQRAVTACCRRIPPGGTLSYGQLAARAGYPGAARAVGNVMRSNRWPLIVPCHRVVAAGGGLGGYSAPDGLRTKRRLLAREGCVVEARTVRGSS